MDHHKMSEFTPELVEEQLARLSDSSLPPSPHGHLVADLYQMYREDERSLQRVWQRLDLENIQPANAEQVAPASLLPVHAPILDFERKRSMHRMHKNSLLRTLSLLAAVCVAAVIVGGMLLVSNLAHQSQASHTNTNLAASLTVTATSAKLPQGIYASSQAGVYRLDPRTHHALWQYRLANIAKVVAGPGVVYLLQSRQDKAANAQSQAVVALDAASGRRLWAYTVPSDARAGGDAWRELTDLALDQNRLYVTQQTFVDQNKDLGQIYVLDATSGQKQAVYENASDWALAVGAGIIAVSSDYSLQVYRAADGKPLWHKTYKAGSSEPVRGITIANGQVYASISTNNEVSGEGQDYLVAYSSASGQQTWQSPVFPGSSLDAAFAVDQQRVYFATFALNGQAQGQPQTGSVYAYDMQSNRQLWRTPINGGGQTSLLISNGVLYTAGDNGSDLRAHLVALNLVDGTPRWQKTLSNNFVESLAINNGVVYAGSVNGTNTSTAPPAIAAFEAASGQQLWSETHYGTDIVSAV